VGVVPSMEHAAQRSHASGAVEAAAGVPSGLWLENERQPQQPSIPAAVTTAHFVRKKTGRRREEDLSEFHHWPQLNVPAVCCLSGCCDMALASLTYPLWHLKTREQVSTDVSSMFRASRDILQQRGVRGLYRGALFGTVGLLPAHSAYICAYEWSKFRLSSWIPLGAVPPLAAAAAEVSYVALATPVEVVTVRAQCAALAAPPLRAGGSLAQLWDIWRHGGVAQLYRGGLYTLASSLPEAAMWWLVYEHSKAVLSRRDLGITGSCTCAAIAASLSSTVLVNPIDVLKTTAQAGQVSRLEWTQASRQTWYSFCQRFFTRGLRPRLAIAAIGGIPEAGAYEAIMHFGKSSFLWSPASTP